MKFAVWGLSLALTAGLYAADEVAFSRVEVSAKLEKTPKIEYGTNNSTSYSNVKMKTQNPSWVVVVVDYTPGFLPAGKKVTPKAVAKGKEGAWIDDIALDVNVEIPGEQDQVTILSGRSDIWTVQLDGRNHVAIMLIPPQIGSLFAASGAERAIRSAFRSQNSGGFPAQGRQGIGRRLLQLQ